jgi:hypothetical protein
VVRTERQDRLRRAATSLLETWDRVAPNDRALIEVMDGSVHELRDALASVTSADLAGPPPKKQSQVLAMLRCYEGASGPQIAEAMGWALHTVRGFLAGLGKKGITIEVLERVRQVGPNEQGAKGSYTVYHITEVS